MTPKFYLLLIYFSNVLLIRYCSSEIYKIVHIFEGFIKHQNCYIMDMFCI
jgi:hypothetical protein